MIQIKRAYERPAPGDGRRILVERLWPRGMKKESLAADAWMKEVAPTTELRKWFDHRAERWEEFQRRYRTELDANPAAWAPLLDAARDGALTLLYSARDTRRNGAVVLRDYLVERTAGHRRRVRTPPRGGRRARPATPARARTSPSGRTRWKGPAR